MVPGHQSAVDGSEQQAAIRTDEGVQITPEATIADDLCLDVLLVRGNNDFSHLLQHEKLNALIQKQDESSQWIGRVCPGAFVLGHAGVLDGKQDTTWFGDETSLQTEFPSIQVIHANRSRCYNVKQ